VGQGHRTVLDTTLVAASTPDGEVTPADKLGDHDRTLLADARDTGKATVTVLVAAQPGETAAAAGALTALGGRIGFRDDGVGYLRATLPPAAVDQAVALPSVQSVDLDEDVTAADPAPGGAAPTGVAALTRQPAVNPYLPAGDTGAATFRTQHPSTDGRGVTIGVLDSGIDLDTPALQKTTTGQRKVVDWITVTDPAKDGDSSWVPVLTKVTGPSFSAQGFTWKAPVGSYEFGVFSESSTGASELAGDVNRDGDERDDFGVLFRPSDGAVWVDADLDHDFTDGPLLRPYGQSGQVGHFGVDDPKTAVAETVPFTVESRTHVDLAGSGLPGGFGDFVNIGLVANSHGTHVAGILAANGGLVDGVAPGAQLISARACTWDGGCTASALTEGVITLVASKRVDVVNISIGSLPGLNDGSEARATLYDRLIKQYGVQIVLSAGNDGPGLNTVGDPADGATTLAVGASVSTATSQIAYGKPTKGPQTVASFSSAGPTEAGGFQPQVVAPGVAVSTVPRWSPLPRVPSTATFTLPPGYALFNGTSMAAPQVTGGLALLISAARHDGRRASPAQLRSAVLGSARELPGVPVTAQGMGLLDVGAADALLRARPAAVSEFVVDTPVCTALSGQLARPNRGRGVYNRCAPGAGGQSVGVPRTYTVTLVRTAGPAGDRTMALSWRGNDGTFTGPTSAVLPRGKAVRVNIVARPTSPGAHAAVLQVDDPGTPGVDGFSLHTVVAAAPLGVAPFAARQSWTVPRGGSRSLFVAVPDGVPALTVALTGFPASSRLRWTAYDPSGLPVEATDSLACLTGGAGDPGRCNPTRRSYDHPAAGVWELALQADVESPALDNPATLTAFLQDVRVTPATQTVPKAVLGQARQVGFALVTPLSGTTASLVGGPLGSTRAQQKKVLADGSATSMTTVIPGTTELRVTVSDPSSSAADVDLEVYRGSTLVGVSASDGSAETVVLVNPAPGAYTLKLVAFSIPGGSATVALRDTVVNPAFGTLIPSAATVTSGPAASKAFTAALTATRAPAAGRQLLGTLTVTPTGLQPITATVLVGGVSG
jgi:hypothetical protein